MTGDVTRVYVGSYTVGGGGDGEGITLLSRDPATGALAVDGVVARLTDPSFLAWHPDRRHLYTVTEAGEGAVAAFAANPDTGALTPLGTQPTGGKSPCHLTVDPAGRYLLSVNYGSGSVAVHPIASDGALGARTDLVQHEGSGPDRSRQEGPHAHVVRYAPDGKTILVCDLGTDGVYSYRLDTLTGRLQPGPVTPTQPGVGPRHLASHPDGHVYVADELSSTVTGYRFDAATGALRQLAALAATCDRPTDRSYPSELLLSPTGSHLYVANRGSDVVTTFTVDSGRLTPVADVPCGGAWPRHIAFVGDHLYVANQHSHTVAVFSPDPDTGVPHQTSTTEVPSPACVLG